MGREEIGTRLKELREKSGFTQKNAAGFLGVDQSYISKWEHGERPIQADILEKLTTLYGCDIVDFSNDQGCPICTSPFVATFRANALTADDMNTIYVMNKIAGNKFSMTRLQKMAEQNIAR